MSFIYKLNIWKMEFFDNGQISSGVKEAGKILIINITWNQKSGERKST